MERLIRVLLRRALFANICAYSSPKPSECLRTQRNSEVCILLNDLTKFLVLFAKDNVASGFVDACGAERQSK